MSSGRQATPTEADILERVEALEEAWDAGRDVLADADPALARAVEELLPRVRERVALGADRTVVALAGSTGSGKSSLLNAVAGAEVARPGVLRPTTSRAVAAVWPGSSPAALLDWLEVTQRTFVDGGGDGSEGLVLLDLPDHDSVVPEHRVRADRLLARADLMIWVTDPQKYADAALHEGYLRGLAAYEGVVVVVLNHADRLSDADRETCLADLRARVVEDGLPNARVLATSATDGLGVAELRALVADAVRRRQAMAARLLEDVRASASRLLELSEPPAGAARASDVADARLVQALLEASGAPTVVVAVGLSARRQVRATAGWPVTRWVGRLRADPLRRLGLRPDPGRERAEAAPEVRRSSLPRPTAAVRARTAEALREHADAVAQALPGPWQPTSAARPDPDVLADALDQVVVAAPLGSPEPPRWARVVGWVQTALLVVGVAGLVWLAALAGLDALRLPAPDVSWRAGDLAVPWPTTLAVGGLAAGALLGALAGLVGRTTAARRRRRARAALEVGVRTVADAAVLGPARARLEAWHACRAAATRAGAGPTRRRPRMA